MIFKHCRHHTPSVIQRQASRYQAFTAYLAVPVVAKNALRRYHLRLVVKLSGVRNT